jgi:hypothetical protein
VIGLEDGWQIVVELASYHVAWGAKLADGSIGSKARIDLVGKIVDGQSNIKGASVSGYIVTSDHGRITELADLQTIGNLRVHAEAKDLKSFSPGQHPIAGVQFYIEVDISVFNQLGLASASADVSGLRLVISCVGDEAQPEFYYLDNPDIPLDGGKVDLKINAFEFRKRTEHFVV